MTEHGFTQRQGVAHRMIDLRTEDETTAVGWLEDDFHHFGVTIIHDGKQVKTVRMSAPRTPWTACTGAGEPLQALVGKPLVSRATDIGGLIEMRLQCTHVFDLTGLLMAHICHREERNNHRRYLTVVPDRVRSAGLNSLASFGAGTADLYCDGELVMHWAIDGDRITGPEPYGGHSQTQGFRAWTETMGEEEAEYAHILRRAILVAGGRTLNHDDYPTAGAMNTPPLCHAFQPERRDQALRNYGNTWDYSDHPEDLIGNIKDIP